MPSKWLRRADADELGNAATMLFVTLLRLEELAGTRKKAKAAVDALDRGDAEAARDLLAQACERAAEIPQLAATLEQLLRKGP